MSQQIPRESAFAYLRVSTRKQDIENQRLQIGRYLQTHALEIGEDYWFLDDAISGTVPPMQRKGFRDMMELLEALEATEKDKVPKHILVYEISRLGRNLWEILDAIKSIERYSLLVSTSPKESFLAIEDKSIRNLLLLVISWAAEREREVLIQRTQEGVAMAKEKHRHSGNIPLGYDIHRCEVGVCVNDAKVQCELHGKLLFTADGRRTYELLAVNPKLRPRELKGDVSMDNDYQRWALIRNVKKFGIPELEKGNVI